MTYYMVYWIMNHLIHKWIYIWGWARNVYTKMISKTGTNIHGGFPKLGSKKQGWVTKSGRSGGEGRGVRLYWTSKDNKQSKQIQTEWQQVLWGWSLGWYMMISVFIFWIRNWKFEFKFNLKKWNKKQQHIMKTKKYHPRSDSGPSAGQMKTNWSENPNNTKTKTFDHPCSDSGVLGWALFDLPVQML